MQCLQIRCVSVCDLIQERYPLPSSLILCYQCSHWSVSVGSNINCCTKLNRHLTALATWWYPLARSCVEKNLGPLSASKLSLIFESGKASCAWSWSWVSSNQHIFCLTDQHYCWSIWTATLSDNSSFQQLATQIMMWDMSQKTTFQNH